VAEETGKWYDKNHEYVTLGEGRSGYGVFMDIPPEVGVMQGTRCVSDLVKVRKNWPYEITVDVKAADGASTIVFVECYRHEVPQRWELEEYPEDEEEESDDKDGEEEDSESEEAAETEGARPIEKCYRKPIHCGSPSNWKRYKKTFAAPERYAFEYLQVKLYAFLPVWPPKGPCKAYFDNVVVRPLTPYEAKRYFERNPIKKKIR
jgi:hypothetical protein